MLWYSPAGQSAHASAPSFAAYFPSGHDRQAATFDAAEYLPTAHRVQTLAPALVRVLVIDPAAHAAQSLASSEPSDSAYRPAAQSVHAPTFDTVE